MLHFDLFRPTTTRILAGRSRPDLVGQMANGQWVVLEAKGRISEPDDEAKDKAKRQAQRVISINGSPPAYQIGAITFFKREALTFYWNDPEPDARSEGLSVDVRPRDWRAYYEPVLGLIASQPDVRRQMQYEPVLAHVEDADIRVGIRPDILQLVVDSQWEALSELRNSIDSAEESPVAEYPYGRDGIAIVAGESWSRPSNQDELRGR